jgi:hypothetical protein
VTATPTSIPTETQVPLPYSLPTPLSIQWKVGVLAEKRWDRHIHGRSPYPGWIDNNVARITFNVYITVSAPFDYYPEQLETRKYNLLCGSQEIRLYRFSDNQLLREVPMPAGCRGGASWSKDESVVAIVDSNQVVHIWQLDEQVTRAIPGSVLADYDYLPVERRLVWSSDSRLLAILRQVNDQTDTAAVVVSDTYGRVVARFQIEAGMDGPYLEWFADNIIANYSRYESYYYEASTGRFLFNLYDAHPIGLLGQSPTLSPNQRWVVTDQSYINEGDVDYQIHKTYRLYDLQTKTEYMLVGDHFLAFMGWSQDGTRLYLVNRPAGDITVGAPQMPFGFLAFDPLKRRSELFFENAIQVVWNPDRSWAFVIYPDDMSRMAGVLWQLASGLRMGAHTVADEVEYADPAWELFLNGYIGPLSTDWATDGRRIVFSTSNGELILSDIDGNVQDLAANLPDDFWKEALYRWSPDDQHLLVVYEDYTWIVSVP